MGADLIAPGNTLESFDAALEAGVDVIEFDVLPVEERPPYRRLMLAHDHREARVRDPATLDEGLDHLAATPYEGVELNVDLKLPGYEREVVKALRARDLVERTMISTQYRQSLRALRAAEPALRIGWSVPRVRRDPAKLPRILAFPVYLWLLAYRTVFPWLARSALRAGRCDMVMAHKRFVTPALVRAVRKEGGDLYAWTVDDADRILELERLGVTGVITNDPRLFAPRDRDGSPARP